jgi:hypothetical protein
LRYARIECRLRINGTDIERSVPRTRDHTQPERFHLIAFFVSATSQENICSRITRVITSVTSPPCCRLLSCKSTDRLKCFICYLNESSVAILGCKRYATDTASPFRGARRLVPHPEKRRKIHLYEISLMTFPGAGVPDRTGFLALVPSKRSKQSNYQSATQRHAP